MAAGSGELGVPYTAIAGSAYGDYAGDSEYVVSDFSQPAFGVG